MSVRSFRRSLPDRAAAIYQRQHEVKGKVLLPRDEEKLERHKEPAHLVVQGRPGPGLLLQGELDSKRQFLKIPARQLRDVAMHLAFDLRKGKGRKQLRSALLTLQRFKPLRLESQSEEIG